MSGFNYDKNKELDEEYETDENSPLHRKNRFPDDYAKEDEDDEDEKKESKVNMMTDWLSVALYDDEEAHRVASTNRALIAVKHRADTRFARYVKQAKTATEAEARVSAIDDELRAMANEVAVEYATPEPEKLYEAAVARVREAAPVPPSGYEQKVVDPDKVIGDTPASSSGESFKGREKSLDKVRGPSKDNPATTQNVEQRPGERKEWLNPGAKDDGFGGTPPLERTVDTENLGGKNPHPEQKGVGGTFGDTHNVADPVTPGTVMAKWHVYE